MKCIECGTIGQGSICPKCYPNCINCDSKKITGSIKSIKTKEYGQIVWCKNCGQIHPKKYITQEFPAEDLEEETYRKIINITKEEINQL